MITLTKISSLFIFALSALANIARENHIQNRVKFIKMKALLARPLQFTVGFENRAREGHARAGYATCSNANVNMKTFSYCHCILIVIMIYWIPFYLFELVDSSKKAREFCRSLLSLISSIDCMEWFWSLPWDNKRTKWHCWWYDW